MKLIYLALGVISFIALMSLFIPDEPEADPRLLSFPSFYEAATEHGLGDITGYGRPAAFSDINGDGFDDIYIGDCDKKHNPAKHGFSTFFINDGQGKFTRKDYGFDEKDLLGSWAVTLADLDNDGDPDLIMGGGGYNYTPGNLSVYENRINMQEGFIRVTDKFIAPGSVSKINDSQWWGVSSADYDNDGWLDVLATRREDIPVLLRNVEGKYFEVQELDPSLDENEMGDVKNPLWFDYDDDGDQDIFIAGWNWYGLYKNEVNEGGWFKNVTHLIELPEYPVVFAAFASDFNQDGHLDLYAGRWDFQDFTFFNDGKGGFTRSGEEVGLKARMDFAHTGEPLENTMGLAVGDFHDDGYPDVVIGTGNPAYTGEDIIFCNLGDGTFARCNDLFVEKNEDHKQTRGHGAVFGDIDHNGSTDFFWNLGGHPEFDIENPGLDSREKKKFFMRKPDDVVKTASIKLEGVVSNRDAIGARITVSNNDGVNHYYTVQTAQGFQNQNSLRILFPVKGDKALVTIRWPSGIVSEHEVHRGQHHEIKEPLVET